MTSTAHGPAPEPAPGTAATADPATETAPDTPATEPAPGTAATADPAPEPAPGTPPTEPAPGTAAPGTAAAAAAADPDAPAADAPATDDRDPAQVLTAMVDHVLALAATWTAWDGRPLPIEDRVYTPHKAIRRVADHLIDHLAELEARLAGEEPYPDHWHASTTTTPADLAPFTADDLDEARSRLTRLARMWSNRLDALGQEQLDASPGAGWTFRQLAFHLTGSVYYADAVGDLTPGASR